MRRKLLFGVVPAAIAAGGLVLALQTTAAQGVETTAAAAKPVTLRFVTANMSFRSSQKAAKKKWLKLIAPHADIVFLQEAKNLKLRHKFVDRQKWYIFHGKPTDPKLKKHPEQDTKDRLGSAILVRKSAVADVRSWELIKGVGGGGCGRKGPIMTRWIAKIRVKLHNGRLIRVASAHMPPARCVKNGKYKTMADNVVKFVKRTKTVPTVIGADWNATVDADKFKIAKRTKMHKDGPNKGDRIDGFLWSRGIKFVKLRKLGRANNQDDHQAVQIKLTFKP